MSTYIIGIDPGPTTGIVGIIGGNSHHLPSPAILQCNHADACKVVGWLADEHELSFDVVLAVESFVTGPRAARLHDPEAGKLTRQLVADLVFEFKPRVSRVVTHPAGVVKPWAVEARLEAAGLLGPTTGMRHARDAARHALFAASHDCGFPDPLSKKARRS